MIRDRKIIYLTGFLFYFALGLVFYINSSFLSSFVGDRWTGIVFTIASICSILAAVLIAPKIFGKIGGYKFLILISFLNALAFGLLAVISNPWGVVIVFILSYMLNTLILFSLDELLKIFSRERDTGKIRGTYLTFLSLALILAQLASGTILGGFSFRSFYLAGFVFMVFFLAICFRNLKGIPEPKYDKISNLAYVKNYFKNKSLSRAFFLSFLVQFFYCWMIIYTPIYLNQYIGFTFKEIGIIFAIMLLPFLFTPVYTGKLADKIGERKILMWAFFIASFATIFLFFIRAQEIWVWAMALLVTRIGISTTEAMSDTYFFKHIRPENEEFVGLYRTASPIAYIVGPITAFILFLILPSFEYLYVVLGILMLLGVYLSSTIGRSDI